MFDAKVNRGLSTHFRFEYIQLNLKRFFRTRMNFSPFHSIVAIGMLQYLVFAYSGDQISSLKTIEQILNVVAVKTRITISMISVAYMQLRSDDLL